MLVDQNTKMNTIPFDNNDYVRPNIIAPESETETSSSTEMMLTEYIDNRKTTNTEHEPRRVSEAHSEASGGEKRRNSDDLSSSIGDVSSNPYTKFAFPFKLHSILENTTGSNKNEDEENKNGGNSNWSSIISWLPSGKAFKIHKPKEFATEIMPEYFSQTKYRSFQRQLHIYGFDRIKDKCSEDYGAYYHELFVRGQSDLCLDMTRKKIKGTGLSNEVRKAKAANKANKRPLSSSFSNDATTTTTTFQTSLQQSIMASQPTTASDNSHYYSNNNNLIDNFIGPDVVPNVEPTYIKTPGRRCSLGFVRGTRMGRRGSLVFEGDEVCFCDKKFYFTSQY